MHVGVLAARFAKAQRLIAIKAELLGAQARMLARKDDPRRHAGLGEGAGDGLYLDGFGSGPNN
jgi:hypothetical protein